MNSKHREQGSISTQKVPVNYDPRLIEETVLRAIRNHADEREFRSNRDRIYDETDSDLREQSFLSFHLDWFHRLKIGDSIVEALSERPIFEANVSRCLVAPAVSKKDEGADLFVSPKGKTGTVQRSIGIQVRVETLLESKVLHRMLRHEFLHIADMLDPRFGYEPDLPESDGGATGKRMLQDRYRALWDATIDGRLVQEGKYPHSIRERALRNFAQAFPMLGEKTEDAFSVFFDDPEKTHAEIVELALVPSKFLDPSGGSDSRDLRCPVCSFPTRSFEPAPEALPQEVIGYIRQDFTEWQPSHGICLQCADLYRAHRLSVTELAKLPRIV